MIAVPALVTEKLLAFVSLCHSDVDLSAFVVKQNCLLVAEMSSLVGDNFHGAAEIPMRGVEILQVAADSQQKAVGWSQDAVGSSQLVVDNL